MKTPNDFAYEIIKDKLSRQCKSELQKEMADMKQWQVNHEDTTRILADINNLKEENEELRNRSMRSTLIFRGYQKEIKVILGKMSQGTFLNI